MMTNEEVMRQVEAINIERQWLFRRLHGLGVDVVPFAGLTFLWAILNEVEKGGN
jgi:hypothetical protein